PGTNFQDTGEREKTPGRFPARPCPRPVNGATAHGPSPPSGRPRVGPRPHPPPPPRPVRASSPPLTRPGRWTTNGLPSRLWAGTAPPSGQKRLSWELGLLSPRTKYWSGPNWTTLPGLPLGPALV